MLCVTWSGVVAWLVRGVLRSRVASVSPVINRRPSRLLLRMIEPLLSKLMPAEAALDRAARQPDSRYQSLQATIQRCARSFLLNHTKLDNGRDALGFGQRGGLGIAP